MIDVVSDASVVLKWFSDAHEEGVEPARELLTAHAEGTLALHVLDLTAYEIGNALLRGRVGASPRQVNVVLGALSEICPAIAPTQEDLRLAIDLAAEHTLTVYDAAYGAVARRRGALLATFDKELLRARLGETPTAVLDKT
ncbi:MAG: type II toxin-antitoxin system VapC family toxin [Candidatus Dormibacteria bacterium]